ncbi:AMP-binding protein [Frankia sp. CNm7]|uniref:AMP-binding protein n=1 Tax=Frankia nepalensis TaxID=1836974 RepID=A0A937RJP4_9ACTN|nr:AMP-binding protein [Frankia nepalensis]MBL7499996.1 AMP-binding protein [Frankia nepalensis]MBL7510658.1 AMP-binding protein [Frankia nepalensis]MBL7520761.1 AMP-binding protein [Frankia nepalensis]MBL7627191.1 AMP-binding protein [Frankia nepalensis]
MTTISAPESHLTWPERIDELASAHPELIALTTTALGGETLTWGELALRGRLVAGRLADFGIRPGDVVCVELPGRAAHVVCALGAWRLGATVLPLRPDLPARERRRLLALADPGVVVVDGQPAADREVAADELVNGVDARPPAAFPPVVSSPAWLIASGGSTGAPKLIASSTSTVVPAGARAVGPALFADTGDARHPVHLVCSPLYHTQGFAMLHHTLVDGYRNVLVSRFDAERVLDLIESERVAMAAFVPTMLIRLLRSPSIRHRDLSSLGRVIQGAGACPEWAIREWIDLVGPERFIMGYGSSEGVCSAQIRGDEWLLHPGSVGRPVGTEVLVVGEDGARLPAGEVGELYFRPVQGTRDVRYVGQAAPRTRPGGYVSIGDLGWLDEDGYLYIADRRTDMVVTGGANVYVSEVEAALLRHPDVEDAVVIGLRDAEWGRRVHAIVQPRPEASRDGLADALRDHCRTHLAAYKVPRTFELVDDLGRADSGKINRRALADLRDASGEASAGAASAAVSTGSMPDGLSDSAAG